jgi:raffinose synthase
VQTLHGLHALYINAGSDPFQVITDAVRAVESHLGTFVHREKKKVGGLLLQLWSSLFCCDCCSPSHLK